MGSMEDIDDVVRDARCRHSHRQALWEEHRRIKFDADKWLRIIIAGSCIGLILFAIACPIVHDAFSCDGTTVMFIVFIIFEMVLLPGVGAIFSCYR